MDLDSSKDPILTNQVVDEFYKYMEIKKGTLWLTLVTLI